MRYTAQVFILEYTNMIKYEIGHQLKQLRSEAGWSLSKAAEETGVSKAMLGQIERNESSPTISTLWKIATGFHRPLSLFVNNLLIDEDDENVQSTHTTFTHHKHDLKAKILFSFDPRFGFEVFEIKLSPEQTHLSDPHDKGVVEHITVIKGKMEVKIKREWKKLSEGDVIRFNADQPHGYRNTDKTVTAVFHNLIYYT